MNRVSIFANPVATICQILGINKLESTKDAEKLFVRANMFENSIGTLQVTKGGKPLEITLSDCHEWRGTELTNRPLTNQEFRKYIFSAMSDSATHEMHTQREEMK